MPGSTFWLSATAHIRHANPDFRDARGTSVDAGSLGLILDDGSGGVVVLTGTAEHLDAFTRRLREAVAGRQ